MITTTVVEDVNEEGDEKVKGVPFSELRDDAKDNAIEWCRDHKSHFFDCDDGEIEEAINEVLDVIGLDGFKCNYSLRYCQGDGVAFKGTIDNAEFVAHQLNMHWEVKHKRIREIARFYPQMVYRGCKVGDRVMIKTDYAYRTITQNGREVRQLSGTWYKLVKAKKPESYYETYTVVEKTLTDRGIVHVELHGYKLTEESFEYRTRKRGLFPLQRLRQMQQLARWQVENYTVKVSNDGYRCFSSSVEIELDEYGKFDTLPRNTVKQEQHYAQGVKCIEKIVDELQSAFKDYFDDLDGWGEEIGYATIEYARSDENVACSLEANDEELRFDPETGEVLNEDD